jgi:hypothetical protein
MQANSLVSGLPRPSPSARPDKFKLGPSIGQLLQYQLVVRHSGLAWKIRHRNIGRLYEFLMKFIVFIYVMKSVETLPIGRSVSITESAEMFEAVRVFGLSPRLAPFLDLEARAFYS